MRILRINMNDPEPNMMKDLVSCLRDGGIVIYPTDTCYGIGCIGNNRESIRKIMQLKQREEVATLSLIFSSVEDIAKYALVNRQRRIILESYLPGPYSFLLTNTDYQLKQSDEFMARIPDILLTKLIAEQLDYPYTSTSANISGQPPAYSLKELQMGLLNLQTVSIYPDLVLDGGTLPPNPPSTMVDIKNWPPKILRQGAAQFDWQPSK